MGFKQHPDAVQRMASARELVQILVDADDLYPAHRREFIRLALWAVTEAEGGKWNTRFRSRASLEPKASLQHDHVYERAKMTDALIADPHRLHEILDMAIGCVVTKEEHTRLTEVSRKNPGLVGWARYSVTGVEIIDMLRGQIVNFSELEHLEEPSIR